MRRLLREIDRHPSMMSSHLARRHLDISITINQRLKEERVWLGLYSNLAARETLRDSRSVV